MTITYAVIALLVGWCGTPWPKRWPIPLPPPPDPWPCPVCGNVVSAVGGLVGGFLVTQVFPNEISLVSVSIGAFVLGRIAGDVFNAVTRKQVPKA